MSLFRHIDSALSRRNSAFAVNAYANRKRRQAKALANLPNLSDSQKKLLKHLRYAQNTDGADNAIGVKGGAFRNVFGALMKHELVTAAGTTTKLGNAWLRSFGM